MNPATAILEALASIRAQRFRTVLAAIGIVIGVAGVVVISGSARSGREAVFRELATFGLDVVYVFRDYRGDRPEDLRASGSGITLEDVERTSRECRFIRACSPVFRVDSAWAQAGPRETVVNCFGVTPEYFTARRERAAHGRLILPSDDEARYPAAVLDEEAAVRLFGDASCAVGCPLRIEGLSCVVVGVLGRKERGLLESLGMATESYGRVHVPIRTILHQRNLRTVDYLVAALQPGVPANQGAGVIAAILARRHAHRVSYTSTSMEETAASAARILWIVEALGTLGAALALIVGGIGIMNVLLAGVAERTREIGIRRALGATRGDIAVLFILEGLALALAGGTAGILSGIAVIRLLPGMLGHPIEVSWAYVAVASVMAALTGVLAAGYPAHRASHLEPAVALRALGG